MDESRAWAKVLCTWTVKNFSAKALAGCSGISPTVPIAGRGMSALVALKLVP